MTNQTTDPDDDAPPVAPPPDMNQLIRDAVARRRTPVPGHLLGRKTPDTPDPADGTLPPAA